MSDLPEWLQEYVDSLSETHDVFINGMDVMIIKKPAAQDPEQSQQDRKDYS